MCESVVCEHCLKANRDLFRETPFMHIGEIPGGLVYTRNDCAVCYGIMLDE